MADDYVPPMQQGGAGGATPAKPGTDYRQVQGPALVDTNLPDNGAAQRAEALAGVFKQFGSIGQNVYDQASAKAGAIAGAAAGATGNPDYKQGLLQFTAYSRAYNNAATRSYLIEATTAAESTSERLQVQAANNPGTFYTTFTAARDAMIKGAPPQAQGELINMWNEHLAQGMSNVSHGQALEIDAKQKIDLDVGVGLATNKISKLYAAGDTQSMLKGGDEMVKLSAMLQGAVASHTISQVDADARMMAAHRQITEDTIKAQFEKEIQTNPDPMAGPKFITKWQEQNRNDPTLPEAEEKKITLGLFTDLKEFNLMNSMSRRDGKTAEQERFEAGDAKYTSGALQGLVTKGQIAAAVRNGDLKPENARAINTLLDNNGGEQKSDPKSLGELRSDPNFLSMTRDEILLRPNISATDKYKVLAEQKQRRDTYENTQSFKDGTNDILRALKIPPGTPTSMLSDAQKRQVQDATQDYHDRMKAADPSRRDNIAETVAQDVIKNSNGKIAAQEAQSQIDGRASFLKQHGPGSPNAWPADKVRDRLKVYDDRIAEQQAIAKQSSKQQ